MNKIIPILCTTLILAACVSPSRTVQEGVKDPGPRVVAINAMATDYQPLARQANNQAFLPPKGLPAGPYNLEYGRDQEKF